MKTPRTVVLALCILAGGLMAGCVSSSPGWVREPATRSNPWGEIMLAEKTPPHPRDVFVLPHDQSQLWVPAYWIYSNHEWIRVPAHSVPLPKKKAS